MGLLVKCEKCSCMFMPGTACPNCQSGGSSESEPSDVMAEYVRRKEQHTLAYTAFMCRGLAGGLVGLIGAVFMFLLTFTGGVGPVTLIVMGFLILFAGGVSLAAHMYMVKHRDDMEIHCPGCDTRVDELPLDNGFCPGCNVQLFQPKMR